MCYLHKHRFGLDKSVYFEAAQVKQHVNNWVLFKGDFHSSMLVKAKCYVIDQPLGMKQLT